MPPLNDITDLRPFQRHIEILNRYDPADSVPFVIGSIDVGRIRRYLLPILAPVAELEVRLDAVHLRGDTDKASVTSSLAMIVERLAGEGHVKQRGEPYRVATGWDHDPLANIDRGAYEFFGIYGYGVHANGFVVRPDGLHMWIGRRAQDRLLWPGKLDNMIGGGLSADYTAWDILMKEAGEEAGFSIEVASKAKAIGLISYLSYGSVGTCRDTIFVYDIDVPTDVIPHSAYGEVEHFELMPIGDVAELVRDTEEFKPNCNLVVIDFLIRHGYFTPDMKGYEALASGLRQTL